MLFSPTNTPKSFFQFTYCSAYGAAQTYMQSCTLGHVELHVDHWGPSLEHIKVLLDFALEAFASSVLTTPLSSIICKYAESALNLPVSVTGKVFK